MCRNRGVGIGCIEDEVGTVDEAVALKLRLENGEIVGSGIVSVRSLN
jgi:hypothetical protein